MRTLQPAVIPHVKAVMANATVRALGRAEPLGPLHVKDAFEHLLGEGYFSQGMATYILRALAVLGFRF